MTPSRNSNRLIINSKLMKAVYEDAFRNILYKEAAKIPLKSPFKSPRKFTTAPKVRTSPRVGMAKWPFSKINFNKVMTPAKLFLASAPLLHSIFNTSNNTIPSGSTEPTSFSGADVSNQGSQWYTPTQGAEQDSQLQEAPGSYDWSYTRQPLKTQWNAHTISSASDRADLSAFLHNNMQPLNSRISNGASLATRGVTASSDLIENSKARFLND